MKKVSPNGSFSNWKNMLEKISEELKSLISQWNGKHLKPGQSTEDCKQFVK